MPTTRLIRRSTVKPESAYLARFADNVTSQFGEDGIIKHIFGIIAPQNKWCVEFGAWDGKYLSNTWTLIHDEGWSGVLIEGDPDRAARLAAEHASRSDRVFVENAYVGWDSTNRLDAILARTPIPTDLDLMSIDIDGNDWHVWQALEHYRPRVVVIEHNPTASNQLFFVQDANPALNQGCSLRALVELGKEKGYELVATTTTNGIFVEAASFPAFRIADNSLDAMHAETITTEIAYGYDGTVFAAGHMMLNWHGIQLTQDDFQILPQHLRKYPDPGEGA